MLPLLAHAGDPDAAPVGDPIFGSTEKLQPAPAFTVIPLSEVRMISMKDMMNNGGINLMDSFNSKGKKKKKKKIALSPGALALAGMSALYDAPRTWGDADALATIGRTPALPPVSDVPTFTRAAGVAAPEPGAALLVLLALPGVFYVARTRSRNA